MNSSLSLASKKAFLIGVVERLENNPEEKECLRTAIEDGQESFINGPRTKRARLSRASAGKRSL